MGRFVGTWTLTRFALRRDRILLPVWIVVFPLMTVFSASATMALYPDEASRVTAASAVNEVPVAVAMYGRIWDPTSLGALSLLKMAAMGGVLIGVLAIMLVTRHARAEEEKGRTELLGATVVGAWAGLSAAVIVTTIALVGIGVLSAVGLTAVGLPAGGSWAFGLSWAVTGLAFAAIAAITNQLSSSARAANAIAMIVLAVAYLLRALGDVMGDAEGPTALSWLSPIGWGQQVRPFAGDHFIVLLIPVLFTVPALWLAFALQARRDLGAGLLPDRSGRAAAAPGLRSPFALAWRLQYPLLVGWLVAYAILSGIVGSIINDLGDMMDTPQAQEMISALGGTDVLMDAFIALEFSILAFITAAYGIVAARRLATEEADGRAEPVLADARLADAVPAEPSDGGHRRDDAADPDPGSGLRPRERCPVRRDRSHRAHHRGRHGLPAGRLADDRRGDPALRRQAEADLRRLGPAGGIPADLRAGSAALVAGSGHRPVALRPRAAASGGRHGLDAARRSARDRRGTHGRGSCGVPPT